MAKEIIILYNSDMTDIISSRITEKNNTPDNGSSDLEATMTAMEKKQDIIKIESNENSDSVVITITEYDGRGKYFDTAPETITLPKTFIDLIAEAYKK